MELKFENKSVYNKRLWNEWLLKIMHVSHSVVSDSLRPHGCNPPGSSVPGILQARILEWIAIPFSRGSFRPRSPGLEADSLPFELQGSPFKIRHGLWKQTYEEWWCSPCPPAQPPLASGHCKHLSCFSTNSCSWMHILFCFVLFFSSYGALWDSKAPHWHSCKRVFYCVEASSSWLLPQDGSPSLNPVSVFIFYILSYLLLKRLHFFSGCLVSSASVKKLFFGSCSIFKWSFDKFVGDKLVSPSYSSAILGLPSPLLLSETPFAWSLVLLNWSYNFLIFYLLLPIYMTFCSTFRDISSSYFLTHFLSFLNF